MYVYIYIYIIYVVHIGDKPGPRGCLLDLDIGPPSWHRETEEDRGLMALGNLPHLLVMVNPKVLKSHTRLILYVDPPPAAPVKPAGPKASGSSASSAGPPQGPEGTH